MRMQMLRDARACHPAKVEADVETIGLEGFRQNLLCLDDRLHQVGPFGMRKIHQIWHFPERYRQ